MSRPYRPKAGFWIRLCVVLIYPVTSVLFRLRFYGRSRIPETGGVLLVMNHVSQADTIAMARLVWGSGRIPRFLIKAGVFTVPVLGRIMSGAGQIPVYRGSAQAADSLRDATAALDRGECVIIYPEGTITQDPHWWPMQAKTGVARLALASPDVPVLPVGQWGAQRTLGRGGRFRPRPRRLLQARIGRPVDLSRFRGRDPDDPETLRQATVDIMRAVTAELAVVRGEPAPSEPVAWSAPPRRKRG